MLTCRLNEAQQSAFQDITNVANERRQLSDELESLRSQFKAYQRVKTREISSLDHRVRILLQSQAVAGTMRPDHPPTLSLSPPGQRPLPSRWVPRCLSSASLQLSQTLARGLFACLLIDVEPW